jgi:hypothetical protein
LQVLQLPYLQKQRHTRLQKLAPHFIKLLDGMNPSNRGFMNYFSQGSPNQHPANTNISQNSPPSQFPIGFPQSPFSQYPAPNFQNFHPFGSAPYGGSSSSFHGI